MTAASSRCIIWHRVKMYTLVGHLQLVQWREWCNGCIYIVCQIDLLGLFHAEKGDHQEADKTHSLHWLGMDETVISSGYVLLCQACVSGWLNFMRARRIICNTILQIGVVCPYAHELIEWCWFVLIQSARNSNFLTQEMERPYWRLVCIYMLRALQPL